MEWALNIYTCLIFTGKRFYGLPLEIFLNNIWRGGNRHSFDKFQKFDKFQNPIASMDLRQESMSDTVCFTYCYKAHKRWQSSKLSNSETVFYFAFVI